MKRWIWLIVLTQLVTPVLAQDEGTDGGGDFFDLGTSSFGNVGRDFDPLAEVRNMLARANVAPMDKTQEKELKKIYDREVKVVGKPFEKRFGVSLKSEMGTLQTPERFRRGGASRRPESARTTEARRLAEQLLDRMIASLRVFDQQGPLRRYQSEQIRITKLNTLTDSMAQAGIPLTPQQLAEAEAILARESRLRTLTIVEARGDPQRSQVVQLEAQTTQRLVALLDPLQRTTYAAATSRVGAPRTLRPAARTANQ
jgi:hypothetical protein